MRKFAILIVASTLLLVSFAAAQQIDLAVGGYALLSSSPNSGVLNFEQPAEKDGRYVSVSGNLVGFLPHHIGINAETSWRTQTAAYPFNAETYRPIFTDVNALYQRPLAKKLCLDLMAGIGVATTRFNVPAVSSCNLTGGGCINYTSSNHFLEHLSVGVHYYVWRNVFVRPEIHYYHIQNNVEFNSGNVFRIGASVGYTFGR